MRITRIAAVLSALAVLPAAATAQNGPTTTLDGVYTAEQAEAGKTVYDGVCVECHAEDEYTGDMMLGWDGAPVFELFDLVASTMPDDNPGSLPVTDYVSVIAYILKLNGMPVGTVALPQDASELRRIYFRLEGRP